MMAATTIGLLHPGEMGSAVGQAASQEGARVLWASEGRSPVSRERAMAAGLEDIGTVAALVVSSDVVLSVCPPHTAADVARRVAALRFSGIYVDANAVSPATAREIGSIVEKGGAAFVDGGIVGPPPRTRGMARLYLSGPESTRVGALFARGPLEAIVLDGPAGAASALKMAYAAYTKGTAALLMAIRALAITEGVDEALRREWERSQPGLAVRSNNAIVGSVPKAWRFVGEMEEMATAFAEAGLPNGFQEAAAEIYRRLAGYKDAPAPPSVMEMASALATKSPETPKSPQMPPPDERRR
jgi:3-hydroxyisobutyrate dehydrogenase-like beta-hydroxyacid dehydrogenase